jgi:hypothetical protein
MEPSIVRALCLLAAGELCTLLAWLIGLVADAARVAEDVTLGWATSMAWRM